MHTLTLSHTYLPLPSLQCCRKLCSCCCPSPPPPRPEFAVLCVGLGGAGKSTLLAVLSQKRVAISSLQWVSGWNHYEKTAFFFCCNYFSSKFSWYFRTAWVNGHHNNLLCVSPLSITMPLPIPCTSIGLITPSAMTLLTLADKEQNNKIGQVYSIVMPDTEASQCMVKSLFVLHSALSPKGWKVLSFGGNMVSESPFRLHV